MFKLFSMSLYFASFLPLWLSVIFIDMLSIIESDKCNTTEYIGIGCILAGILISTIIIFYELHKYRKRNAKKQTIKMATEEKTITTEYLLSYILPLFAFDFTVWHQVILFLVFFLTFGYLCIRHNHFSVNILLEIMNYRFYQCILENSDNIKTEQTVMSRQRLNGLVGQDIYVSAINNDYSLDVGKDR